MTDDYKRHLGQALRKLKSIESERTLLKGHFSLVAKQYHIKVTDLKNEYNLTNKAV